MPEPIVIGTRGSPLALHQAEIIRSRLASIVPQCQEIVIKVIKTLPDRVSNVPLSRLGRTGVFVRELEQGLLDGEITIAVHSLKDLYTNLPGGLCLAAVSEREDPRDVLISREGKPLAELPQGALIGTGSPRRQAQLHHILPDLRFVDLRGNLETRLRKLSSQRLDAIVLAAAGLHRCGLSGRITEYLSVHVCTPAAGQGILGIEAREDDPILEILRQLNDRTAEIAARAERTTISELGGGCSAPMGVYAEVKEEVLVVRGVIASLDGATLVRQTVHGNAQIPEQTGKELAQKLKEHGGAEILAGMNT